jgi:folate-binding protein YgfZ
MPTPWSAFFQVVDRNTLALPAAPLLQRSLIAPLDHCALLQLEGTDSARFLQGQLTCDVYALTPERASLAAHCTPKGRMVTAFELARRDSDRFWLRLRADLAEPTTRQFGKYLPLYRKAKLSDLDQHVVFGLAGPAAAGLLQNHFGTCPDGAQAARVAGDAELIQLDASGERFECWLPAAAAADLWQAALQQALTPAHGDCWRWLLIRAGIAELEAATSELFIPQMVNYPELGAVSFSKGCYTGQEIIARAHYRGQVKRHLIRAGCDAPAPAAGSELLDANGRAAGQVVDAVALTDGRCELLAVVGDATSLRTPDGRLLQAEPAS